MGFRLLAVVAVLVALAGSADALERRVALVIGNGAYGDLGTLPNPPNDAADIAKALESLDFEVIPVIDGDVDRLRAALRKFGRQAVGADIAEG